MRSISRSKPSFLVIRLFHIILLVAVFGWGWSCKDTHEPSSTESVVGFEALWSAYFQPKCAQEACHGGTRGVAGLRFVELEEAYAQLINAHPTNAPAAELGLKRVFPQDLERSFLWAKLSLNEAELSNKGWGAPMPMATDQAAGEETLRHIKEWIEAGAPLKGASLAERGITLDERTRAQGDMYVTCAGEIERNEEGLRSCFAPPEDQRALRLYTPPLTIPPHSEVLICSYLEMPITEPLFVNRTLGQQMTGGHHAAVFLAVSPSDEPPHECRDEEMSNFRFAAGAGGGGGQDTQLPPAVALKIEPGQQFVIQSHYLNPSDEAMVVMDAVDLMTIPEAEVTSRVDPFALIQGSFEVPTGGAPYEVRKRCRLEQDIEIYMLLGHTHDYGVLFEFYHYSQLSAEPRQLYRATDGPLLRDNPEIKYFDPPLPFLAGDEVEMVCVWENDGAVPLGWPEEMCVALMYYGPGQGWMTCSDDEETPNVPSDSENEGCVEANAEGNEFGVGRACSAMGGECQENGPASLCLANFDSRANFCSFLSCQNDQDCGEGATCLNQGPATACVPSSCAE